MQTINGWKWFTIAFKKYFTFSGRSTRSEFWYFILFQFLINFFVGILGTIIGIKDLNFLSELILLIPNISVAARRLHDTNHSGWWQLLPIVNIIFFCQKSDTNDNRFGPPTMIVESPHYTQDFSQLEKLAELRDKGAISEHDFQEQKNKILNQ
ncbi:DUF805 domain-containing protein [Neokomagataea thailandica]|uniref:DUF805 domain-containing protein n=1 Tax=Neokomagataea TaxID=1223423 RepID=UPI0008299CB0|nr:MULTISPECIES: DUF805 domain-containing protein [Neokomagataea]